MLSKTETSKDVHGLERTSIVERLVKLLRDRILKGEWEEGRQLRQEAIADEYGVSRMPVREALRQLEAEGFVRFRPNKGIEVSALSPADIDELFDLRIQLEADLLEKAIKNYNSNDIEKARQALDATNYRDEQSASHWGELNWHFHKSLYKPAQKPHTLSIAETLAQHTDRYVRIHLFLTDDSYEHANKEHTALFNAYEKGEASLAKNLLIQHIADAKNDLLNSLKSM